MLKLEKLKRAPMPRRIHKHQFKPKSKYNAKKTEYNGVKYDSIKEAKYAQDLDLLVRKGEVLFYLRQVPIDLPGKVKYRVDFQEFHSDGTIHFVDVKGVRTKTYIMKKKQVEDLYPITIEEV
jgi:hypothetical protein